MILTCAQMKAVEERAFERGVKAEPLMEEAGTAIGAAILDFFRPSSPGTVIAFCGKGNNAGDALVAARYLQEHGWRPYVRLSSDEENLSELSRKKLEELRAEVACPPIVGEEETHQIARHAAHPLVLLDGFLGIGAGGDPREPIASLIREMNAVRERHHGVSVAIDIPSGLNGDTGEVGTPCITADLTCTVAQCKAGLVADSATAQVGRLAVLPLDALETDSGDQSVEVLTPHSLRPLLKRRQFESFKGTYGRIGIVAGSVGYLGAARLCSMAAVLGGGGLVTLYVPEDAYPLLATSVIPEVMVKPIKSYSAVLDDSLDAIGLGPGLGFDHETEVMRLIRDAAVPMVVDADALTMVGRDREVLRKAAGPRLLTPHPGEMHRLAPELDGKPRREIAETFAANFRVTLLLKGSRTVITESDHPTRFNTTGNPGMGSGGMGDVLTGLSAALIGQGYSPLDAASLGGWVSGRSAELAVWGGLASPESLHAGEVAENLGLALNELRAGGI